MEWRRMSHCCLQLTTWQTVAGPPRRSRARAHLAVGAAPLDKAVAATLDKVVARAHPADQGLRVDNVAPVPLLAEARTAWTLRMARCLSATRAIWRRSRAAKASGSYRHRGGRTINFLRSSCHAR